MTTRLSSPSTRGDRRARGFGHWCLIAVAMALPSGCRGLEPTKTDRVAQADTSAVVAAVAQTQDVTRLPAPASERSLSDQDAARDVPQTSHAAVIPVGHTTPVTVASGPRAPHIDNSYCPPAASQPAPCNPCGPALPPGLGYCPGPAPVDPYACPHGLPCGGWTPPGLVCPWPEDEYLCDGGDQIPTAKVRRDWSVDGLELEDTVVHYDTVTGDTHVQPSNRVCVYAPRFAAVRKVYGIVQHDAREQISGVEYPLPIEGLGDVQGPTTTIQPVQPGLNFGTLAASGFRERTPPTGLENSQGLVGTHGGLLPYEDFTLIQNGQYDATEKARLAERVAAAMAWSHDLAIQVLIDDVALKEDMNVTQAESVHIYSLHGKPRLRICKVASRHEAKPGETVEFTIRFDNLGDQVIGNVTVIDNLTTRLEYVEDSQSCTPNAEFSVSANQGASLTLRWEIIEPMKVGQGGVIRFQCRVR